MLKISRGIKPRAQKIVIYGCEGIGKTTLATQFPKPLVIDTEGGTSHLDVDRIDRPQSWDELINIVHDCCDTEYKTIVLDTADWAESVCIESICSKYNQKSIESFGYGKGYTYVGEEFTRLLKAFDEVIAKGKNVVITAHAKMRKFEQPDEMGAYDRWEMKLSRQSAPLVKEWADMVLFCNYQTMVITDGNNKKAQGGKRVMYASHHPCWDAKNRHGLPDKMDLSYEPLKKIFDIEVVCEAEKKETKEDTKSPYGQLTELMKRAEITPNQLLDVLHQRGKGDYENLKDIPQELITKWCIKYFSNIVEIIKGANK